ncbi:MAG: hypothetical protein FWF79_01580, partial [Defluviitaleaceae bacterium]|nr:hypothetical protein [Defluviitaleaceae bacterium]
MILGFRCKGRFENRKSLVFHPVKCGQSADQRFFSEKPHRGGRFARIGEQKDKEDGKFIFLRCLSGKNALRNCPSINFTHSLSFCRTASSEKPCVPPARGG